ncbi:transcriptional regulator ATRX-like isoform X3 [Diabrotica virgifera virgifera]|uniref:Transcriptional regulator ATRX-like n=1 Tax=Diabrotica virgifera virgifera TaxID=50390 RepID=A0ABM5K2Z1_DIAVI|nr:transcriptional regulator ATRX-like isoform X3 [Diabrotica virgifera virgifera]
MSQERKISELKGVFSETLKDLLTISLHTQNVCTELVSHLENENFSMISADAESLGNTLANILKMLKGNSTVFVDTLLSAFSSMNSQRPANFFAQMYSTLLECKHNAVINTDGRFSFAEYVDRDIQTDSNEEENKSNINMQAPIASTSKETNDRFSKEETTDNSTHIKKECDFENAASLNVSKSVEDLDETIPGRLSLNRQDTSDTTHTNESWMDTLQRSQDSSKKSNGRNSDENMVVLIKDDEEEPDGFYSVPTQKIVRKTSTPLPISKSLVKTNTLPVHVEMEDHNTESMQAIRTPKMVKNQNNLKQKNQNSISNVSNDQLHENLPSTSSCKSPEHQISDDIDDKTKEHYSNIDSIIDKVSTEDFEEIMKSPTNISDDIDDKSKKLDLNIDSVDKVSTEDFEKIMKSPTDLSDAIDGKTEERYLNIDSIDKVTTEDFEKIMKSPTNNKNKNLNKRRTTDELMNITSFEEYFDIKENSSIEIELDDKKEGKTSQACATDDENEAIVDDPVQSVQSPRTSLSEKDNVGDISKHSDDYYNVYSVETQPISSDEENERNSERQEEDNSSQKSPCDNLAANENENYIENDSSRSSNPQIDDSFDSDADLNVEGVPEEISNTTDAVIGGDNDEEVPEEISQATNKCFSDSDETDIEKTPVIKNSVQVQLNFDNFALENSNSRAESINSESSFDFINSECQEEETTGSNEISTQEVVHSAKGETQENNEISTHEAAPSTEGETPGNNEISIHEAARSAEEETPGNNEISTDEPVDTAKDQQNENNEDTLMDVDLVEYLSDCEDENQGRNSSQDTICYYVKTDPDEPKTEGEATKSNIKEPDIGDELLELLSDQKFPDYMPNDDNIDKEDEEEANKVLDILNNDNPDNEGDEEEADKVLNLLNNDDSVLSDSIIDSDTELSLSDCNIFGNDKVLTVDSEEGDTSKDQKGDCYVLLERLPEKSLIKYKRSLNDNIDWLCDIDNLSNIKKTVLPKKRRRQSVKEVSAETRHLSSSSSDSDDGTDENSDTSSDTHSDNFRNSFNLDSDQLDKLDAAVAEAIRNNLEKGSEADSDSSSDSDESVNKEKKKKKTPEDANEKDRQKEPLSKEELAKKAWRNDALLRGKLSSSESNDSEADKKDKIKSKHKRYEDDTDFGISSDHLNTDSDSDNAVARLDEKLNKNQISPIKQNIPVSDSDSDSDSDVQYVSPIKKDNDEVDAFSPSQKGRRNIRSIQSDEILAVETQIAKKEELERIERLRGRNSKLLESLSQSTPTETEQHPPLILDVEEKTNKILVKVTPQLNKRLKPHQRKGVKFMWDSCYESLKRIKQHPGSGCILAHCMGLGKTFQVLALVHALFTHDEINAKHVLIVCPLSTVNNWRKEVKFVYKGLRDQDDIHVYTLHSRNDIKQKYDVVTKWHLQKKSILIMGYEAFETVTNHGKLDKNLSVQRKEKILEALVDPGPDLVVCDEGHLIKNKKAVRAQALNKIKTKRRIVLTGTPLQNNLVEYYHMVHFVKPNLLGTLSEFRTNFVNPITNGQYEDSTSYDISLMRKRTHVLHKLLGETVQRVEDTELEIYLPKMLDYAVFIQLHQLQCDLYNDYCNRHPPDEKKSASTFLSDVHMLQYIGAHPHLLNVIEASKNKKIKQQDVICEDDEIIDMGNWWKDKMPTDASEKLEYGHKMLVLKTIIEECEEVGDKLLVFSQKIIEMDLIEHFLAKIGTKGCRSWRKKVDYYRMDGTVKPEERSCICDRFNEKNSKVKLLLMSVKVGGLGLNLTAANRVVIMTVNWNPSYDTQSIFRTYRFGQTKEVYVYRLIALGAMEEKIYQRTVTKLAIAHRVIDKHQIDRHYKSMDLQELYACRPSADNERPTPNVPEDKMLAKLILQLPCIYKYHEHKALLIDRHEEKLTEDEMAAAWEDFKTSNKKEKDLPPPPSPQLLQNGVNMPTFEQAYNLGRSNLVQASTSWQHPNHMRPNSAHSKQMRPSPMHSNQRRPNPTNPNPTHPNPTHPNSTYLNRVDKNVNALIAAYMANDPQFLKKFEKKLRPSPEFEKLYKEMDKRANASTSRPTVHEEKRTNNNLIDKMPSVIVQNVSDDRPIIFHVVDDKDTPSTSAANVGFPSAVNRSSSTIATNSAGKPSTSAPNGRNQIRPNSFVKSTNNPFQEVYKQYQQITAKRKNQFEAPNIRKKIKMPVAAQSSTNAVVLDPRTVLPSRENMSNESEKRRLILSALKELGVSVTEERADKENEDQLNVSSAASKKTSTDNRDLNKNLKGNIVSFSSNGSNEVTDLTKDHEENFNSGQNSKRMTQNLNRREKTVTENDDVISLL